MQRQNHCLLLYPLGPIPFSSAGKRALVLSPSAVQTRWRRDPGCQTELVCLCAPLPLSFTHTFPDLAGRVRLQADGLGGAAAFIWA